MTSPEIYPALVLLLLVILGGFTVAALVSYALTMALNERKVRRAEAEWRIDFDAMPEAQQRAGTERLLRAVLDETPIYTATALHIAQAELTDESLARAVEGWLR